MRTLNRIIRTTICLLFFATSVWAIDYGAPLYLDNLDQSVRVEAIYNKFDRDVKFGGEQTSIDSDLFMLRLNIVGEVASIYFDGGLVNDDRRSGETPAVLGGGVQILSYDGDYARISLQLAGHWVPKYDTKTSGVIRGDIDYYELGGGVVFSGKISQDTNRFQVVPYLGIMYSVLNGDRHVEVAATGGGWQKIKQTVKHRDPLAVYAGLTAIINETFSGRLEYSFISDKSISLALGIAF